MKAIILAGGAGTRLYPATANISKQLLPVYDKPMIYYPLGLLMMCKLKEVAIITTPRDVENFKILLGDGSRFGIKIEYFIQDAPRGISEAYILTEEFLDGDDSIMILGDNVFHGNFKEFREAIKKHQSGESKGTIFAYPVKDPERYGVVEFDRKTSKVLSIEEKPEKPKSNYAIPGLYIFDGSATKRAKNQKPSERGELEITDLIKTYLEEGELRTQVINRGMAWLDTGTPEALIEASNYIAAIEQRQGLKVACLEEIALRTGLLSEDAYKKVLNDTSKGPYQDYLKIVLKDFQTQN